VTTENDPPIAISELDSLRFGVVAASGIAKSVAQTADFDRFCRGNGVQLLIVRCPASAVEVVQALQRDGARVMDCMVCYRRDFHRYPADSTADEIKWITPARPEDAGEIASVAMRAFQTYRGHYHADARLQHVDAAEVYHDWATRLCSGQETAHTIFVARQHGALAGFAVLRRNSPSEAEAILGAVEPQAQGSGIPLALGYHIADWVGRSDMRWFVMCTQVSNIPLQRALIHHKCEIVSSHYVFHQWYDR